MKKIVPFVLATLTLSVLVGLFFIKDNLTEYTSLAIKGQLTEQEKTIEMLYVDSAFNYARSNEAFEFTFLEFGAKNCSACLKMEEVMQQVENQYKGRVKVIFINAMDKTNLNLLKYYGISAIPTQVLLDRHGVEYFRHTGYISVEDLSKQFRTW
jgi:thiol-disulfide isomerase/thioredoxin